MPTKKKRINKDKSVTKKKKKTKTVRAAKRSSPTKTKKLKAKKSSTKTKSIFCPSCRERISAKAIFCSQCGYSFKKLPSSSKESKQKKLSFLRTIPPLRVIREWGFERRKQIGFIIFVSFALLAILSKNPAFAQQMQQVRNFTLFCSDTSATSKALDATVLIKSDIGYGSGFFIDENHVITNNHVVETTDKVKVTDKNKQEVSGKVVGWDNKADIAIIQVESAHTSKLSWRKNKLSPGSTVIAIGFPLPTLEPLKGDASVTKGTVSAYRQGGQGIEYLQTDTSINPGNSGGPLVDSCGRVVGINVLFFKPLDLQPTFYAISAESAQKVIAELRAHPTTSVPEGTYPAFDFEQDPKAVLAAYYASINNHQLLDAYQLFTSSRQKRWKPEDWQKNYDGIDYMDIKDMTVISQNPLKVQVNLVIYSSDGINNLKQDSTSTWTFGYSAGNLLLDALEIKSGEKKAIYDQDKVSEFREFATLSEVFYSSILKKDLSIYSSTKVNRMKTLIELNKKDIQTIMKKLELEKPLTTEDLKIINEIDQRSTEIKNINQEFVNEDLKRFYEQFTP